MVKERDDVGVEDGGGALTGVVDAIALAVAAEVEGDDARAGIAKRSSHPIRCQVHGVSSQSRAGGRPITLATQLGVQSDAFGR